MKERKPTVYPTMPMIQRMLDLRRAGLSVPAIRVVIELDFGRSPEACTIRRYTSGWSLRAQSFSDHTAGRAGLSSGPNAGKAA